MSRQLPSYSINGKNESWRNEPGTGHLEKIYDTRQNGIICFGGHVDVVIHQYGPTPKPIQTSITRPDPYAEARTMRERGLSQNRLRTSQVDSEIAVNTPRSYATFVEGLDFEEGQNLRNVEHRGTNNADISPESRHFRQISEEMAMLAGLRRSQNRNNTEPTDVITISDEESETNPGSNGQAQDKRRRAGRNREDSNEIDRRNRTTANGAKSNGGVPSNSPALSIPLYYFAVVSENGSGEEVKKDLKNRGIIAFVQNSSQLPLKVELFLHRLETSEQNKSKVQTKINVDKEKFKKWSTFDVLRETPLFFSYTPSTDLFIRILSFYVGRDHGIVRREYDRSNASREDIRKVLRDEEAVLEMKALVEPHALNNLAIWAYSPLRF